LLVLLPGATACTSRARRQPTGISCRKAYKLSTPCCGKSSCIRPEPRGGSGTSYTTDNRTCGGSRYHVLQKFTCASTAVGSDFAGKNSHTDFNTYDSAAHGPKNRAQAGLFAEWIS
jgi:hypothetical protein